MFKTVVVVAGLIAATSASAKPTYLSCDMINSDSHFTIEVTMDEDNQQVTLNIPKTNNLVRRPAQFTADRVVVPDGEMVTYYFNRLDGSVVRRSPILDNKVMDTGKCVVASATKRAF